MVKTRKRLAGLLALGILGATVGGCGNPPAVELGTGSIRGGGLADDGTAVVCQYRVDDQRGLVVDPNGTIRRLQGPAALVACPLALNNRGQAVGHSGYDPVAWDVRTGQPRLLALPEGFDRGSALDVNDSGTAVGWIENVEPGSRAGARWDVGTGQVTLLRRSDDGNGNLVGQAINDRGVIVARGPDTGLWTFEPTTRQWTRAFTIGAGSATGINERGELVASTPPGPRNYPKAISLVFDPATGTAAMPEPPGVTGFLAREIDEEGRLIGPAALPGSEARHIVRYDRRDGSVTRVDPEDSLHPSLVAINGRGQVLGVSEGPDYTQILHVWS